jgi:hypothetical protein
MKRLNNLPSVLLISLLTIIASTLGYAQNASSLSDYQLIIQNLALTSDKTFEFDLELLDTDPKNPFELALIQAGILVNPAFYEGGKVTASIVPGSSQLIGDQQPVSILFAQDAAVIKLPSKTLKPLPKDAKPERRGTLISAELPGTRICRIKLTNTIPFTKTPASLKFNFQKLPYPTTVSQYIDGINTPLPCNEKNCIVKK